MCYVTANFSGPFLHTCLQYKVPINLVRGVKLQLLVHVYMTQRVIMGTLYLYLGALHDGTSSLNEIIHYNHMLPSWFTYAEREEIIHYTEYTLTNWLDEQSL